MHSPCSAGSSTRSCRCRSVTRAAPTWWSSITASPPSTRSRARRSRLRNSTRASSSFVTWRRKPAYRSPCCAIWTRNRRRARWAWCSTKTRSSPATRTQHELASGGKRLNGCVGWTPKTDEVIEASKGAAKMLVSNRNLLVVADVLAVNKGFASANPKMVQGLVHGILEGNRRLRDNQAENIAVVAKAFKWTEEEARDELSHVHLSNLPENRAFFAGTIDSAGSFGGIFQSSVLAYGNVIKNPTDPARFVDTTALDALAKRGLFADQKIAIAPDPHLDAGVARGRSAAQQGHPLLLRGELIEPRSQRAAEPGIPADHQALSAGEPWLHRAAARPCRQRARRGIPPAGRRTTRAEHGAQGHGAVASTCQGRQRRAARQVSRRSTRRASRPSAAAGKNRPAPPTAPQNRRVEVQWFTIE